jgi:hypothetical protein
LWLHHAAAYRVAKSANCSGFISPVIVHISLLRPTASQFMN